MVGPFRAWLARHRLLGALAGTTVLLLLVLAGDRAVHVPGGLTGQYFANTGWRPPIAMVRATPALSTARLREDWNGAPPPRFSAVWDGFLIVPRTGRYTLATRSDDGSWVYVDGRLVVDNGGRHGSLLHQASLDLTRGPHMLSIRYFQGGGPFALDLLWARGDGPLEPVPGAALTQGRTRSGGSRPARWPIGSARPSSGSGSARSCWPRPSSSVPDGAGCTGIWAGRGPGRRWRGSWAGRPS